MTAMHPGPAPEPKTRRRAAQAALIGTVLEFYDFQLFAAVAATTFPKVFFPESSPFAGILASVATFSVAYVVRPFGGVILGSIGDRIGRQRLLIFTLLAMGIGTTLIGLIPSPATIGWAAPVLLVLARMVQGVGTSGEFNGSTLVAMEYARPNRRGLLGSIPATGAPIGGVLSTLVLLICTTILSDDQFVAWGWRIPFLLSGVLVAYGLWLRRRLPETPEFRTAERKDTVPRSPVRDVLRRHARLLVTVALIVLAYEGLTKFFWVFVLSYANEHGLSQSDTFVGLLISQIACASLTSVFGLLSDRIGRRWVIGGGFLVAGLMAFPFFTLISPGQPAGLWIGLAVSGIVTAATFGPLGTLLAEALPVRQRYSGMGLARETGTAAGAAVTPPLAVVLTARLGGGTLPLSLLLIVLAVIGLVALALVPRTRYGNAAEEPDDADIMSRQL